jgi:hypothetical protein
MKIAVIYNVTQCSLVHVSKKPALYSHHNLSLFQISTSVLWSQEAAIVQHSVYRRATGWTAGVRFLAGARYFFLLRSVQTVLGPTQRSIQWMPGAHAPEVKRPGRETSHSPPSNSKFKEWWSHTSTPSYIVMAWCLIN